MKRQRDGEKYGMWDKHIYIQKYICRTWRVYMSLYRHTVYHKTTKTDIYISPYWWMLTRNTRFSLKWTCAYDFMQLFAFNANFLNKRTTHWCLSFSLILSLILLLMYVSPYAFILSIVDTSLEAAMPSSRHDAVLQAKHTFEKPIGFCEWCKRQATQTTWIQLTNGGKVIKKRVESGKQK